MTWLSEIERRYAGKMDLFDLATKGVPRMSRVIRELAKGNREAQAICNGTPEKSEPRILDDAITEILGVLADDLSPDAKELVTTGVVASNGAER